MRLIFRATIVFLFISIIPEFYHAYSVSGKITDSDNFPIAFATVYVRGTTKGTISNQYGEYNLEVGSVSCTVVFQLTGYQPYQKEVKLTSNFILNVILKEDIYQLNEVKVDPLKEDPAYAIIRAAQGKRSYFLDQVNIYSCDVYIKGLQRITKYPKKFFGKEINLNSVLDTSTGIAYLSESFSKFYFKKPDKIKETLISSKVSGRNNAFTFNQATDVLFNFYENVIQNGISQRGLISPISSTCFLSYRYKFCGSFFENGVWINKIQVNPKRESDPCFTGHIYVCDSTWRLYNVDLFVTKQNQIKFVDTLKISQVFLPVNDSIWMPFTNKLSFSFNFFGFVGDGYFNGINTNYEIEPKISSKFFNGEEWYVNSDANKKALSYWDSLRPVPLTELEQRDYVIKDSLNKIWESKPYKDSLDKKENKFKFINAIQGYSFRNSWRQFYINVAPPATSLLFNTVQGWNFSTELSFLKRNKESRRELDINIKPSYGFSSNKLYLVGGFYYLYNPRNLASISADGGSQLAQFNSGNPISPLVNTIYSLLDKKNFMKTYKKDFFNLKWRQELFNGFLLTLGTEFSERTALKNSSNLSWADRTYEYSSNDPLPELNSEFPFEISRKFELMVQIRLRMGQRYYSLPNRKITLGSKYPEFNFTYLKATEGVFKSVVGYDFLSLSVSDRIDLKRWGKSQCLLRVGKFFNQRKMTVADFKHFNGNQTIFSSFDIDKFQLLPYYEFSTNEAYIEGWFEHNFCGLIMSKLPFSKKIQLEELFNFRYFQTNFSSTHLELGFGLKYLLLRTEFVVSPKENQNIYGFRIGMML